MSTSSLLILAATLATIAAVPLPGSQPVDYVNNEQIPMFVNKIWSSKTQLPYNYYSLPFCKPDTVETEKENIGQILIGDRIKILIINYMLVKKLIVNIYVIVNIIVKL